MPRGTHRTGARPLLAGPVSVVTFRLKTFRLFNCVKLTSCTETQGPRPPLGCSALDILGIESLVAMP